jgi:hypothetical protein
LVGIDIARADAVEITPQYRPSAATARNAAQALFAELCRVPIARGRRSPYQR